MFPLVYRATVHSPGARYRTDVILSSVICEMTPCRRRLPRCRPQLYFSWSRSALLLARQASCSAVRVEWRPVDGLVACAAGPGGVAAAVTEASLITDEHPAGAELVAVRAPRRRVGDPLPGRGLYHLARHDYEAVDVQLRWLRRRS